jgi:hypothetical protein
MSANETQANAERRLIGQRLVFILKKRGVIDTRMGLV